MGAGPMVPPPALEEARAVRNTLSLLKSSMRLLKSREQPDKLFLDFSYYAPEHSVMVTVYCCALERQSQPWPYSPHDALQQWRPLQTAQGVLSGRGSRQHFSQLGGASAGGAGGAGGSSGCIDISHFTRAELTHVPPSDATSSSSSSSSTAGSGGSKASGSLPGNLYPLVIVLEAAGEGAEAAAMSGSTVTCQCTYATLCYNASAPDALPLPASSSSSAPAGSSGGSALPAGCYISGQWTVRTLKQKLRMGGSWLLIRELFGGSGTGGTGSSSSSSSSSSSAAAGGNGSGSGSGSAYGDSGYAGGGLEGTVVDLPSKGGSSSSNSGSGNLSVSASASSTPDCVICLSERSDTFAVPCRHLCMCFQCAQDLRKNTNKCPICRTRE